MRNETSKPPSKKTFADIRDDGRFVDTAGFVHASMKARTPALAFDAAMDADRFPAWRERLRAKVRELMAFPDLPPQPPPRRVRVEQRDGYRLERWEAYPEPYSVVPFLLLVPDGVSDRSPAPAVMCFPGSRGSKESLAGEPELDGRDPGWSETKWRDNRMAWHVVRTGMIAVAMDNPASAESASPVRDRAEVARSLLWAGRNYLGLSVFQKMRVLDWLAQRPAVDAKRIATCGLSLGSDPADIVALLNPDCVAAVIHNDFVCDWRERTIATKGDPDAVWHVVPGMYSWYDAPDVQAALAPRPLLFTEGGRTIHIDRIRSAYAMAGAADNVKVHYYKKYAATASRKYDGQPIPEGISQAEYLRYANVDKANHRYHPELIVPWLKKVFAHTARTATPGTPGGDPSLRSG